MANNAIETVMGAVVLAVAGGFLYFAYNNSNVKTVDGYAINADFTNITGVGVGSDVRVGGIKVGVVETVSLDPTSFSAVAHMRIEDTIKLPKDSSAAIQSAGLLGEKFVAIEPGGDENNLKSGDTISFTQSSVSLEEMIGKFVFSGGGADKGESEDAAPAADEEKISPASKNTEEANPLSSGLE
jgi:phospholipid/cholesterol/gamma-HCH transport system substrate-binding protein